MMNIRSLLGSVSLLGLLASVPLACSGDGGGKGAGVQGESTGGAMPGPGPGPNPVPTGIPTVVGPQGGSGGGSGGESSKGSCAAETTMAEPTPLDLYIMLDISGSMLDAAGGGMSKWTAVKSALSAFFQDPASAGISVGIQYFPLRKAGVPATCTSDAECGTGGPCFLKWCPSFRQAVAGGAALCATNDDCKAIPAAVNYGPCTGGTCSRKADVSCSVESDCYQTVQRDFGPCDFVGQCASNPALACNVGSECLDDAGNSLGECVQATSSFCFHGTECSSTVYATPAVEIVSLQSDAAQIMASIEAQMPDGDTPSGPALGGAIAHAQQWATTNPGHTVVAVLATDGLPTECLPDTLNFSGTAATGALVDEVASIAQEGLFGTPSVATSVIGVFAAGDTSALENLNLIARAGGTQTAQIIDAGGNVTQQFLEALNKIRKARLACEYQIPENNSGKEADYMAVNVEFNDNGASQTLFYVGSADRCTPDKGGWYYDDTSAKAPTKILICPSTCNAFQSLAAGSVAIKLGCRTMIF